ncbi:acyl-CoA carboxylase subunit beta [Candidatus Marimicrobium litorale]|uniref:Acyl-CoA carboxylase n=1 Tax=Candidatus Marimicrobium litorale TaxID=2518991 RepID=A0ABT3T3V3_9GAMM|nr:carboxyl transferase domain-containing protein [Candidatus Marimicrobium litorale]MCX2976923.1 acyl-CoA carboxylase [Candidatus Marimicrobium litorale]
MSDETTSRELLERLDAARAGLEDKQRPEAVAKRRADNAWTARERIHGLLDDGSFRETGGLVEPDRSHSLSRGLQAPADGAVMGCGQVDGRTVQLLAQDYTVLGGSIGTVADRKMGRLIDRAVDAGQPLLMLLEGGGHRIQDGMNAAHFAAASPVFNNLARTSGWVPNVVAIMGQGFAGPTAYAALADFVVMIRDRSTMGMAGPALVKAGTGEDIDAQSLGGSPRQADENGLADLAVEDESACFVAIRRFLSYLPEHAGGPLPVHTCTDPVDRSGDELLDLVSASSRRVYDMRKVIDVIADQDSVFELKPDYARNMITAFARLDGRPVGFMANQPLRKGGVLDTPACEKAAHFVGLCDAFGLPLISLIDIPGFAIGTLAENTGIGRRSARLFYEMALATVPLISVVLRKGYGGGYYAMGGGRAFNATAALAWPTAEICAMSIEGAVDVAFRKQYEGADDSRATRQKIIDGIRSETEALQAASDFGLDDVIDPRTTRRVLIETLRDCATRRPDRSPPRRRSISPI